MEPFGNVPFDRDASSRQSAGADTRAVVDAVKALIEMMSRGGIHELDLSFADVVVRLRGMGQSPAPVIGAQTLIEDNQSNPHVDTPVPTDHYQITAPMIGTFYGSPSPGEPPYVRVGDQVEVGQIVGIIEAMKIMNEIAADRAGIVQAVLAESGQAVEFGSPLLRLASASAIPE